jgi:hypothetical protein
MSLPDRSEDAAPQTHRRAHRRKSPDRQAAEIRIRIALMNRFFALATAAIVRLE